MRKLLFAIFLLIPTYCHADITTGLTMELEFNGSTTDASGNGNNGTAVGTTSYITGNIFPQAINLSNTNSYVYVNSTVANFTTNAGTVAGWFNFSSISGAPTILYSGAYQVGGFYLFVNSNGSIEIASNQSGAQETSTSSTGVITTGGWNHIALTISSGATPTFTVYVNGTSVISATHAAPGTSSENFQISSYNDSGSGNMDVQDIRTYSRALTSGDITQLYDYTPGSSSIIATINKATINNATIN